MKSASSSSNDIPPAVEMARAIGTAPLSSIGTALINPARLVDTTTATHRKRSPPPATGQCPREKDALPCEENWTGIVFLAAPTTAQSGPAFRDRAAMRCGVLP